ncbi:hypothetical protein MMYC01_202763 [Madurella mycetomatis]|uniref:C2H2-type domain-containing protein n=1 Tax=Madurella mycetomatis TaxID=100816 RepID=A0A175WD18_9PEZI|nr:hypothetical protein MMYC01_202763 [Madurella mycetomatis]
MTSRSSPTRKHTVQDHDDPRSVRTPFEADPTEEKDSDRSTTSAKENSFLDEMDNKMVDLNRQDVNPGPKDFNDGELMGSDGDNEEADARCQGLEQEGFYLIGDKDSEVDESSAEEDHFFVTKDREVYERKFRPVHIRRGKVYKCCTCGRLYASRRQLFRHVYEECVDDNATPAARTRRSRKKTKIRVDKYIFRDRGNVPMPKEQVIHIELVEGHWKHPHRAEIGDGHLESM